MHPSVLLPMWCNGNVCLSVPHLRVHMFMHTSWDISFMGCVWCCWLRRSLEILLTIGCGRLNRQSTCISQKGKLLPLLLDSQQISVQEQNVLWIYPLVTVTELYACTIPTLTACTTVQSDLLSWLRKLLLNWRSAGNVWLLRCIT